MRWADRALRTPNFNANPLTCAAPLLTHARTAPFSYTSSQAIVSCQGVLVTILFVWYLRKTLRNEQPTSLCLLITGLVPPMHVVRLPSQKQKCRWLDRALRIPNFNANPLTSVAPLLTHDRTAPFSYM